jgi:hypothetical protein
MKSRVAFVGVTPMLFVADVEGSSRWYQMLLGTTSAHGGPESRC